MGKGREGGRGEWRKGGKGMGKGREGGLHVGGRVKRIDYCNLTIFMAL